MSIAVPDELQVIVGLGTNRALTALRGSSMSVRRVSCKTSRERMCPEAMSRGVRVARWTQIGAIERVNVPWRPVEWRLPCQVNCRNVCKACKESKACKVRTMRTMWNVWPRTFCSRVQGCRSVGPIMTLKPIQSQFGFSDIQIEPGIFDGLDSGAVAVLIHVSF